MFTFQILYTVTAMSCQPINLSIFLCSFFTEYNLHCISSTIFSVFYVPWVFYSKIVISTNGVDYRNSGIKAFSYSGPGKQHQPNLLSSPSPQSAHFHRQFPAAASQHLSRCCSILDFRRFHFLEPAPPSPFSSFRFPRPLPRCLWGGERGREGKRGRGREVGRETLPA